MFKVRSKSLDVYARKYRQKNEGSKICKVCDEVVETAYHLALYCKRYERERERERRKTLEVAMGERGIENFNDLKLF